jgi:uridine kinase
VGLSEEAAARVLAHALGRPPTLGTGRLVCVDGPAGAGKTTLALDIARQAPGALVLHTDEMLEGWGGLPGLGQSVCDLLAPLSQGLAGRWRRWDWHASDWAATETVRPTDLLVLEGVGSAPVGCAQLVTTLVWVETPRDTRLTRWWDRDGEAQRPYWDAWLADEAALHARDRTRERADLVVDGVG